jgi:superfamily II DNA or RNA helicase
MGQQAFLEALEELKKNRIKTLLFEDDSGYWTYSGLISKIKKEFRISLIGNKVTYPATQPLPWSNKPEFTLYPFQTEALKAMTDASQNGSPVAIEVGTGGGKSAIILYLCKHFGLKTVVAAPSASIARQLEEMLLKHFGPKYIGFYGDGTKKPKQITVCVAQSLVRLKEEDKHWDHFASTEVFIADESHQWAAETLNSICFGSLKEVPYRFFLSATQFRNDGLDMLLEAITGPVVYTKTIKELIKEGYLADLKFTMVRTVSSSDFQSKDINEMTRRHLYYNPRVNKHAAGLANSFCDQGKQVLILIDEFEQFSHLLPYLKHDLAFAHGGGSKDSLTKIAQKYHKPDNGKIVEDFNNGKIPILIGTSAISTGTDIKANKATIYLVGGKSEIQVLQGAVGRSTRNHTLVDKKSCNVIDYCVDNISSLARHSAVRKTIYNSISSVEDWFTYG